MRLLSLPCAKGGGTTFGGGRIVWETMILFPRASLEREEKNLCDPYNPSVSPAASQLPLHKGALPLCAILLLLYYPRVSFEWKKNVDNCTKMESHLTREPYFCAQTVYPFSIQESLSDEEHRLNGALVEPPLCKGRGTT